MIFSRIPNHFYEKYLLVTLKLEQFIMCESISFVKKNDSAMWQLVTTIVSSLGNQEISIVSRDFFNLSKI